MRGVVTGTDPVLPLDVVGILQLLMMTTMTVVVPRAATAREGMNTVAGLLRAISMTTVIGTDASHPAVAPSMNTPRPLVVILKTRMMLVELRHVVEPTRTRTRTVMVPAHMRDVPHPHVVPARGARDVQVTRKAIQPGDATGNLHLILCTSWCV